MKNIDHCRGPTFLLSLVSKSLGIDVSTNSIVLARPKYKGKNVYLWKLNEHNYLVSAELFNFGLDIKPPAACSATLNLSQTTNREYPIYKLKAELFDSARKTMKWSVIDYERKKSKSNKTTKIFNKEINSTIFHITETVPTAMAIAENSTRKTIFRNRKVKIYIDYDNTVERCDDIITNFERGALGRLFIKTYTSCRKIPGVSKKLCLTTGKKIKYKPVRGDLSQKWVINEYGHLVSSLNGLGIERTGLRNKSAQCGKSGMHLTLKKNANENGTFSTISHISAPYDPQKLSMRWRADPREETIMNSWLRLTVHSMFEKNCKFPKIKVNKYKKPIVHALAVFQSRNYKDLYLSGCQRTERCRMKNEDFRKEYYKDQYDFLIPVKKNSSRYLTALSSKQLTLEEAGQNNESNNKTQKWVYNSDCYIVSRSWGYGITLHKILCVSCSINKAMRWKVNNYEDMVLINKAEDLTMIFEADSGKPILAVQGLPPGGVIGPININNINYNSKSDPCFTALSKERKKNVRSDRLIFNVRCEMLFRQL
ncbi:hypothetical protein HELRODRAFT_183226 [Helobdella robusta]|uniref:Uncharacterized protein n=1 Tax=Helobdella robusta TaxID=6412 RepID=T1FJC4_HELRO|nr:hypothetical protein HELRODRAFT_183226 [Helobdella robusta]ESO11439.1 hypothetical protein HELRODRAFT_183226 [Helobdella robusta]